MDFYRENTEKVLDELKTTAEGLTSAQSQKRLEENGMNKLEEPKRKSLIKRFLSQLADPMIIILLVAAAVSGFTAFYAGESFADVFIILFVVILNSVLGVLQEGKAEKAIDALKEMSKATTKVLRDGVLITVPSEQLCVGDVIHLEAGDSVPADCRIIESASLKAEEAALTGESVPSEKTSDAIHTDSKITLGDRKNMLYMGCSIVYGRCSAVVTSTGMKTEMGSIAKALILAEEGKTPLQIKLSQLSKVLTVLVLVVCAVMFGVGLLRAEAISSELLLDTFMIAVSLAVAAIPEGLSAVVTIVLSIGVSKMAKQKAIIRKLSAVETLGCTQIICSDKTGTLTQNKMTVTEVYSYNEDMLTRAMALCNDSVPDGSGGLTGEPTENGLAAYALTKGYDLTSLRSDYTRVGEAPFDSMRKMMTTVHRTTNGFTAFTKGAPDEVLKKCTHYLSEDGVAVLDELKREKILAQNKEYAEKALRILAAAYKEHDSEPEYSAQSLEEGLIFIGLSGMMDPVRPEVKDAVEKCRLAGIRPVMITGDHIDTATAIGKELGIISEGRTAITGLMLDELSDEEFEKRIEEFSVYARVQPDHKVRIVNMWRKKGFVTAMTGDGVNDAPSIKNADIGIGMGITGTDVTKSAADMILADDNFATIVSAVEEGRRIYDNIRKVIQFLLSSNLSEVISIFTATIIGFTILKPVHILWINLITDSIPALALGMEQSESDTMQHPPRDKTEGIFAGGAGIDILYQGFLVAALTVASFMIGYHHEFGSWGFGASELGMTMAFLTMSLAEVFHSFNMRSLKSSVFTLKTHNKYLYGAMGLTVLLTTAVVYIAPLAKLFGFAAIPLRYFGYSVLLALVMIPVVELVKLIKRIAAKSNG